MHLCHSAMKVPSSYQRDSYHTRSLEEEEEVIPALCCRKPRCLVLVASAGTPASRCDCCEQRRRVMMKKKRLPSSTQLDEGAMVSEDIYVGSENLYER